MKLYLSSYKIGNESEQLKQLFEGTSKKVVYISNALNFTKANEERVKEVQERDIKALQELGLDVEPLDLRSYFGKLDQLREKMAAVDGVWISGGSVFILRQALKLSGFDKILQQLRQRKIFVYGGYSAAGCVLSPSLRAYQIVDDPLEMPYPECQETLWEGLEMLPYAFMPHYDSDHSESADIAKEIHYCIENKMPFVALRDGEVLILEV